MRVLLTIDTELTWRHRRAGWERNLALSYDPAGVGVRYQLDQLRRHGLRATFFVDPMPALAYGLEPVRRMVAPILAAGQEVQLHIHPAWHDLARGREQLRFELSDFTFEEQSDLIATARDLLVAAGAPAPVAFRAGSYAANGDTLRALAALGIAYDSSHNGAEHPHASRLPFAPTLIDPARSHGVTEIPVSQIARRDGGLRPFQLCALSSREMEDALLHAARNGHPTTTIVGHSFELATRDGMRVNGLVRGRFDRLCTFLADNRATMSTARFDSLKLAPPATVARPLPPHGLRTAWRMTEQAWGTARYEKPALGATMIAMPPLLAMEELVSLAGF